MTEFMHNHIIHYSIRRNNDLPVELNQSSAVTTTPPALEGLDAYAQGKLSVAIGFFENCISLDPTYTPAREMLLTAQESLLLEEELRQTFIN